MIQLVEHKNLDSNRQSSPAGGASKFHLKGGFSYLHSYFLYSYLLVMTSDQEILVSKDK